MILLFLLLSFNIFTSGSLYLNLMKNVLINTIYEDKSIHRANYGEYSVEKRECGKDWPSIAHSMIGMKRMNNIQVCCEDVIKNNIPGDFVETGVWRGGATIFMRAILKEYGVKDRLVWVADSFEGLPSPNGSKYPDDSKAVYHKIPVLAVSIEEVKSNFKKYFLLDNQVKFLQGWFKDTLPNASIDKISVLRLDGDMYESTIDALNNLYPKLSKGGYCIIDDYGVISACKKAVHDYRKRFNIQDEIIDIDGVGVFWKKA